MPHSIQEIRGAVARGWCADANRAKEMDSDLADAISQEIWTMLHPSADEPSSIRNLCVDCGDEIVHVPNSGDQWRCSPCRAQHG